MPVKRLVLLILAMTLVGSEARSDIYRYRNSEGVECYTDAPTVRTAVRVVRETKVSRHRSAKPSHPVASPTKPVTSRQETVQNETSAEYCLPVPGRITSSVGLRHDPIDGIVRDHKGVDIAIPEGTPVRPVAAGVVEYSGYRGGYGNMVIIRHDDGMLTIYAHNSINLKVAGDPVDRGSTIAFTGSTGRSTGPHLHFEAWKDGTYITTSFIPGESSPPHLREAAIRRIVQADGTLKFTNY